MPPTTQITLPGIGDQGSGIRDQELVPSGELIPDPRSLIPGDVDNGDSVIQHVGPHEAAHGYGHFSPSKAIKYGIASLGAQSVFTMFNMSMPFYLESYGTSPWLIGLLANERSLVGAFVQPIVGRLSDNTRTRMGKRRPFFLVGIPLTCLSLLVLGLHPPFLAMIAVMSVAAFFLSVAMDPYMALMADVFPRPHRGRVGGYIGLASASGTVVFLLLAFFFWERAEFVVFALVAVVLAVCFAITFLTVKEEVDEGFGFWILDFGFWKRAKVRRVQNPKSKIQNSLSRFYGSFREFEEARKYIVAVVLYWGGGGGVAPFITLFAKHSLGAEESIAFLLPVGYVVSSLLFVLPAGYMADRVGKKKVLTVGLALYALGAIAGSQASGIAQGVGVLVLLGIANSCLSVLLPLLMDLIPTERAAEVVGIASAMWSLSQPIGSVVAGIVVHAVADVAGLSSAYRVVFLLAGIVMGASVLMLQRVRPERAIARPLSGE